MFSFYFYKRVLIILIILAISAATYVFAASNTVPSTKTGDGAGIIGDYSVSGIQYLLNTDDPRNIDQVALTLNAAAATVKARVVSSSANWYSCSIISGFNWACATTIPQVTAQNAVSGGQLRVIAVQ